MSKFKAEELKDVVVKCTRFSTTTGLIPEYGFLALRDGYIFATDGRVGIRYRNPVSIPEEFILPAGYFRDFYHRNLLRNERLI